MKWNLVGSIYGRSSLKRLLILSRSINKHGHHRQFLFLIGWFLKKSSPLKPLGQMNRNLVGSIFGRSSIKIPHLVPICLQTWLPQTILVSDWLISKKSSPLKPLGQMNRNLVWKHPWNVLYKDCSFSSDPLTNMATKGNSCFWLVDF
jgi:hypothetical protein